MLTDGTAARRRRRCEAAGTGDGMANGRHVERQGSAGSRDRHISNRQIEMHSDGKAGLDRRRICGNCGDIAQRFDVLFE
jgi:hypothetical protein